MAQESNAWVFDSLVGFLHGPVWNAPLQTFIEEKSIPFEPNENDQIEDSPEIHHIHEEYKNLVDVMLSSFMDDLGISPAQLEEACLDSREGRGHGVPHPFHQRLFEQIWAANDYAMFVRMMTRRNVELQLQALDLIETRVNLLSESDKELPVTVEGHPDVSLPPHSEAKDEPTASKVLNQEVATEIESDDDDVFHLDKVGVIDKQQDLLEETVDSKDEAKNDQQVNSSHHKEDLKAVLNEVNLLKPRIEVSESEVQQRREYLKKQRDMLVKQKKQVREKELEEKEQSQQRVNSSKAARRFISGEKIVAPKDGVMASRLALVERLKKEVVNKA